jgi:hypothetical protein
MVVFCGLGWARGQISVSKISLKVWDFFYHLGAFSFSRILVHFQSICCSFNGFKERGRVGAQKLSVPRFGHCPSSGVSTYIISKTWSIPSPDVKGTGGTTGVIC